MDARDSENVSSATHWVVDDLQGRRVRYHSNDTMKNNHKSKYLHEPNNDLIEAGDTGVTHEREGFSGHRIIKNLVPGLILEDVRKDDEGEYRCRVDFMHSPTSNLRIKLIVIGKLITIFLNSLVCTK